jgi:hypothetical protein
VPWIPLGPILGFVGIGLVPMQAGAKKNERYHLVS